MTGTSSAYGMYLLPKLCLNKNIFSLEKWGGGGGSSAVPKDIDKDMICKIAERRKTHG